jgi:hypothetical protein
VLGILTLVNEGVGQQHIKMEGTAVKQIPNPSYTLRKMLYFDTSKLP